MYPFDYQNVGQQLYPQIAGGMNGIAIHPILLQLLSGIFQNRGMAFPGGGQGMPQQPQAMQLPKPVPQAPQAFPAQAPQLPQQAQAPLGNFPTAFNARRPF